ncbi:hypothetical protein HDU93_003530 [Gonapodya sp. JEL0774]|nr:hypothetical protein HDU93_003530 [Gonapodya sp. JEL0774]
MPPPMAAFLELLTFGNVVLALVIVIVTRRLVAAYDALVVSPLRLLPSKLMPFLAPEMTLWYILRGKFFSYVWNLHSELGSIVRVGPDSVSIADPRVAYQLLRIDDISKNEQVYRRLRLIDGEPENLLQTVDRGVHKRARRMVSPAFSIKYLNNLEHFIYEVWETFEHKCKTDIAASVDGSVTVEAMGFFHNIAMDVIGTTAFGKSFGMVESGKHPLLSAINNLLIFAQIKMAIPILQKIPWKYLPIRASMELMSSVRSSMLQDRQNLNATGVKRTDILQMLLDHVDSLSGTRLTPVEVTNNANLFIIAGSETSSNVMAWFMYFALRDPKVHARLVEELDNTFPNGLTEPLSLSKLKTLTYLDAAIKETMRLRPVVTGVARKLDNTTVVTGIGVDGIQTNYTLPAGTKMSISFYAIQTSPKIWLRAGEFLPERWMSDSTDHPAEEEAWGIDGIEHEDSETDQASAMYGKPRLVNRDAYWPFSLGSRDCVGRNFALNEIRMVLGHLFRRFEIQPAYDPKGIIVGTSILTLRIDRKDGLPLRLIPRKA